MKIIEKKRKAYVITIDEMFEILSKLILKKE